MTTMPAEANSAILATDEREAAASAVPVSVVIPVRNEELSLPGLVASLKAQTVQPAEVIVVDGGSSDHTVTVAQRLFSDDSRFRVVQAGMATPGRGRNVGIELARYDWIALTDAGNRVEPEWLERLLNVAQRDSEIGFVYGNFEPVVDSFFTRCAALAYVIPKRTVPAGSMRYPFIASSLLRRKVWESVGGFPDLRAAEDLIFMEKVESQGIKVGYAPEATTHWRLQPTLGRTFERFAVYSRHNIWAGRQRFWHYGIARFYLIALFFLLMALVYSPWWLTLPLAGMVARVGKSIWKNREGRGLLWALNPIQFGCVSAIIFAIDLATFTGWAQALMSPPPRAD
jgi:glycosyltransferase involved in cell wall biosynthesis